MPINVVMFFQLRVKIFHTFHVNFSKFFQVYESGRLRFLEASMCLAVIILINYNSEWSNHNS